MDYYPTYKDIWDAFLEYGKLLPPDGEFIYCADNEGASDAAIALKKEKSGIRLIPYGFEAEGDYKITEYQVKNEKVIITLKGFPGELAVRIPGRHTALNTAAAVALCSSLVKKEFGNEGYDGWNDGRREGLKKALEGFGGSKRRSEIYGEAKGILFMDDYGHHPTAIKTTLEGLKDFYPKRRLVLSFMSHTYTRTAMLLDEFAESFEKADVILLHKIYASAREVYKGGVTGKTLFEKTIEKLPNHENCIFYAHEVNDGFELMKGILRNGDLFITMGAGDNWKLGKELFNYYSEAGMGGEL
jgi:UDP-N-acetylmuramate--alanine ligase